MFLQRIIETDNEYIISTIQEFVPEVRSKLDKICNQMVRYTKREIRLHEAAYLYALARQFNYYGANILEIGTCHGWSASVIAEAAPMAQIVTCTPRLAHVEHAREHLQIYPNVAVVQTRSQDYLANYIGPKLDMVFVDGDHENVIDDLPWYNWLKVGGLMLHHDYTPPEAPNRPCRPVWEALNNFSEQLHSADVLLVGENREGMAGWYRQENEVWILEENI